MFETRKWLFFTICLTFLAAMGCSDDSDRGRGGENQNIRPDQNNPNNPSGDVGTNHGGEDGGPDNHQNMPDVSLDDADPGEDASSSEDASPGEDAQVEPDVVIPDQGCTDVFETNLTWTPDAAGTSGQFNGSVAYDGEALWLVHTRVRTNSMQYGVFVTRMGCDGQELVSPRDVVTGGPRQTPIPVMAYGDELVYVAWVSQDPNSGDWSASMRILSRDGTFLHTEQTDVTPMMGGEAVSGLMWEPAIAALPGGGAVLAVSAMRENGFRAVLQRIDSAGQRDDDAFFVYSPATQTDQKNPT
ncbi:MAG: hypothetical protein ACNA8W_14595, partial [Bradymonadaceae bacterium]